MQSSLFDFMSGFPKFPKEIEMAQVFEIVRQGIRNSVVTLNVTQVDNEVTIALNNAQIAQLTDPPDFSGFSENLTGMLENGEPNVLVLSLVNYAGGAPNPVNVSASLNVGAEQISLNAGSGGVTVPQGLYAQFIVVLTK
jgi:hypothetical protein